MKCFKNKDILGNIKEIYIVRIIKNLKLDLNLKLQYQKKKNKLSVLLFTCYCKCMFLIRI